MTSLEARDWRANPVPCACAGGPRTLFEALPEDYQSPCYCELNMMRAQVALGEEPRRWSDISAEKERIDKNRERFFGR